jgi:hypothetical protein
VRLLQIVMVLFCVSACSADVQRWDFEGLERGVLPVGWRIEATGQDPPSATWQGEHDPSSPLGPGVLQLTDTHHAVNGVFNLCWTQHVTFKVGEIAVFLKANSGAIDQGGGPIWRVQDRNNYYIARYNPLEKNVSIYYTKNGLRIMLAYTGRLDVKDGWHLLKISHKGNRIRAYLDGDLKLMVNDSGHIDNAGGVGLWTKADAATTFDDFTVIKK